LGARPQLPEKNRLTAEVAENAENAEARRGILLGVLGDLGG
jgi:hypothetical protein